MSDLNDKKEMTKEEFAANEIREFCAYVMHPDSDLHKDAEDWIKERLQANDANASDSGLHLQRVSFAKRKGCRCYEVPPKKDFEKCDTCGKPYEYIRQT